MIIYLILFSIFIFVLVLASLIIEIYIFEQAPFLKNIKYQEPIDTSLTVIIPTYNEEENIINCLNALSKIKKPSNKFKILLVDDSSTDKTILKAQEIKNKKFNTSKELEIISAGGRPSDKNWVGKNWACFVASKKANSEWILFIDADVILKENCIYNALHKSYFDNIDLLSLAPRVNCNCLAEWMVQPIMTSLLMIGFPISATNDLKKRNSFAAGPFMLFKANSYRKVGGHEGTYDEVVEDLALAKKIKNSGFKLNFLIAIKDISINMYRDLDSLLEGWSKNWFLGLEKDLFKSISASIFVLLTYSLPWLLFLLSIILSLNYQSSDFLLVTFISLLSLITYALKRFFLNAKYDIPYKYWYLNGLGGIIVFYISIISIYKTYTGKGWTWKGRNLQKF